MWPSERKQPLQDRGVPHTAIHRHNKVVEDTSQQDLAAFSRTLIYPKMLGVRNTFSKFHSALNRNCCPALKKRGCRGARVLKEHTGGSQ